MLPIAPFALFGAISNTAHGMVPLAYALGAIVMAFTARSYALLSADIPSAGSAFTYTRLGFNDHVGFFAGWLVLLDYALGPGLLYVVSAAALNGLVPEVPRWGWISLFVMTGTGINFYGVKVTATANVLMLLAMLLILAIFLLAGALALHAGKGHGGLTWHAFYDSASFRWSAMSEAVLISSVNFLGFDAITTLGEEVRGRRRNVLGVAGFVTLSSIAALFVLQTWVAADLAPGASVRSADTAFYDISKYASGPWLYWLTAVSTALAWGVSCAIVCQSAIVRILFAMGRDRQLPLILARLHSKTHQPYVANGVVGVVSLAVGLSFQDSIDELVIFQNFGALSAFVLVNLSVVGYFWVKRRTGKWLDHLILPIVGASLMIALLCQMKQVTLRLGITWLVIGALYYLVMRRLKRQSECWALLRIRDPK